MESPVEPNRSNDPQGESGGPDDITRAEETPGQGESARDEPCGSAPDVPDQPELTAVIEPAQEESSEPGQAGPDESQAVAAEPDQSAVGEPRPAPATPEPERAALRTRPAWLISTSEMPIFTKIDLSEAYAAVRRRATSLRRRRIVSGIAAALVMSGLLVVIGTYYVSSIPLPDALSLPATTTVYYADGTTVMARLGVQNRVMIDARGLPAHVSAAVVAAEDPDFWQNSTTAISRQYARAAATGIDVTSVTGRARLLVMSWKLEDQFAKDEILGFYLNTVYFGRGAHGVEAASQAYFDKNAVLLTKAEAIVLAGMIGSPGDGRFDPSVNPSAAQSRFAAIAATMVSLGFLGEAELRRLEVAPVRPYDSLRFQSGMDKPTGLVVSHVLAELRATDQFRGRPGGTIENGGFTIVSTIDASAQKLLELSADETVSGSVMYGQPDNLQAAAAVVEPGTGRIVAYYGGHDGTGADYAGWYVSAGGVPVGYGAHPPGQTMGVYTLAAALADGVSVKSRWAAPSSRAFPASGRSATNPVRDPLSVACQPTCDLIQATTESLNVPYFALTETVGVSKVIDMARAAGVNAMWMPESPSGPRRRVDLADTTGSAVSPDPFGPDIALGRYPVTVLDQASAMATFAAGGVRAPAHFVRRVTKGSVEIYADRPAVRTAILGQAEMADLTWTLSQNPAGRLPSGRPSASKAGVGLLRDSAIESAHAWLIGYTGNLGMAVWIGNEEIELPLRDATGARVSGTGLPAQIYRGFMDAAHDQLDLPQIEFDEPAYTGDEAAGDADLR